MLELDPNQKIAGVLAPVFALRGREDLGIGDTEALKEMITWAARHGFRAVQILPVNETGCDSSPYNLLSAMALEPSTIATFPEILPDLDEETFQKIADTHDLASLQTGPVQYRKVKELKTELLVAAFKNFQTLRSDRKRAKTFAAFAAAEKDWLDDYSFHRALVAWNKSEVITDWPAEHQAPDTAREWFAGLAKAEKKQFQDLKDFYAYVQWVAYEQWLGVRQWADDHNVALIGDVPVGVSLYSADVWSTPHNFDLIRSSGAPPEKVFKSDPFTEQWGQNWGFPLYNWDRMAEDDYLWWRRRLRALMRIFHLMRVDHALGFFRIYSFPWRPERNAEFVDLTAEQAVALTKGPLPCFVPRDDTTEENREFNRVHGKKILAVFLEETGAHKLVAEDLGEVAPYVRPTLAELEIPGFKIPQWERHWDRLTPGSQYQRLSLATFATHDHPPLKTVWTDLYTKAQSTDRATRDQAIHAMWEFMDFCGHPDIKLPQPYTEEFHAIFVKGLFASNSWLAVHMITDLLGTDERFNVPGLAGDLNWTQRLAQPVAGWDEVWKDQLVAAEKALKETGRLGI